MTPDTLPSRAGSLPQTLLDMPLTNRQSPLLRASGVLRGTGIPEKPCFTQQRFWRWFCSPSAEAQGSVNSKGHTLMSLLKRSATELVGTFWLAPLLGAVIGGVVYRWLGKEDS